MDEWHWQAVDEVKRGLGSGPEGLSHEEAKLRLKKFGLNHLQMHRSETALAILLRQFHNPLIYILLGSALLAVILGKSMDAAVVLSVVFVNTLIGFIQEYRSAETIHALLKMIPHKSTVVRAGRQHLIASSDIVPGDIVMLQAGDRVPADMRLIQLKNLSCDESALTGESLPAVKRCDPVLKETALAERKCMAYSGTLVKSGTGVGVVTATGMKSEFGKISEMLESVIPLDTPLKQTLNKIASRVTTAIFILGSAVFAVGYLRGYSMLDAGISSIALAVAAIPEGLPAAITIAAAVGVRRMARRKAIIRHLLAVETLGSTTVICTDKTGTLTQNQMSVQSILPSSNSSSSELLRAAVLCSDATDVHGDPTEIALLIAAKQVGIDVEALRKEWPRRDVIPFESERGFMATMNLQTIFLKGAPETVLKLCHPCIAPLHEMTRKGLRVIAVAKKKSSSQSLEEADIQGGFELLGLLGMIDPPRPEVANAIRACQAAGVAVKMITGDHPLTAQVIGEELQLGSRVVLGSEIDQMSNEEINNCSIFARALPEHKLKIVNALQSQGHVVAMTGDGVNDAPALKRANIGVSMGITGTAVCKEASDMVLADDNFASIEAAVEEGRRVYDNLIKSIAFMFPTNLAQALVILIAVLFFPIQKTVLLIPILPIQILWINLIVCVALALPLAFETMEPDIMHRPPRSPNAPILSTFVLMRTLTVSVIMTVGTIGLFFWQLGQDGSLVKAQTMAVTALVFYQIFYLFSCRSLRYSIFKIGFFSNPYVLLGVVFVILTQIGFVYLPITHEIFGTAPLNFEAWIISIGVALTILPAIIIEKRVSSR